MIDMAITCLPRWLKAVAFSAILNKQQKSTLLCNSIQVHMHVWVETHMHIHTLLRGTSVVVAGLQGGAGDV